MNRSETPSSTNKNKEARNAVIIAGFMTVFMGALSIYFVLQGEEATFFIKGALGLMAVVSAIACWLSYKGHVQVGILLIMAAFLPMIILNQLQTAGDSLLNGLMAAVVTAGVAFPTLSGKWLNRTLIAGIVTGGIVVLIDVFGPTNRPDHTAVLLDYVIISILFSVLIIILMRQLRDANLRPKLIAAFAFIALIGSLFTYGASEYSTQVYTEDALPSQQVFGKIAQFSRRVQAEVLEFIKLGEEESVEEMNESITELSTLSTQIINLADEPAEVDDFAELGENARAISDLAQELVASHRQTLEALDSMEEVEDTKIPNLFSQIDVVLNEEIARNIAAGNFEEIEEDVIPTQALLTEVRMGLQAMRSETLEFVNSGDSDTLDEFEEAKARVESAQSEVDAVLESDEPGEADLYALLNETKDSVQATGEAVIASHANTLELLEQLEVVEDNLGNSLIAVEGWILEDVRRGESNSDRAAVLSTLLALGMSGLFGLFMSNLVTRPVARLVVASQKLGEGDLSVQANVKTSDEIGALASSFNNMAGQLRQTLGRLDQRIQQMEVSAEVSRRLSTILEEQALVKAVVTRLQEAFNYYHVHIYLLNQDGDNLIMAGGTGDAGAQMLAQNHAMSMGRGLVGRAAQTNSTTLVSNVLQSDVWVANPLLPETRSEIALPIAIGDRVLGVLDVQSNVTNGLGQADQELLQSIASQVAIALQNARLYEQSRQAAADLVPFKLGFERSASAIFMTDLAGNIYYVNPAFTELYGYTEAEVLGKTPRILKSGLVPDERYNYIWKTLLGHDPVIGEMINRSKDGRIVHVSINLTSILDDTGTPLGFLAIQTDITDRKVAESVLDRRVAELNGLSEIGRKAAETPSVPEFLSWTTNRIPSALVQPETCVAAVMIGDDVYGDALAITLRRQMVEELRVGGEHLGRLYIAYTDDNLSFTDDDSAFIGDVGRRISSYIDGQTLLQTMAQQATDMAQQAAELQTVAEIGTAVSAIRDPQQLLQTFVDMTKEKFNLYHAHLFQYDVASDMLQLTFGAGDIGQQMVAEKPQIAFSEEKSLVARTARSRQGVLVNNVQEESDFLPNPLLPDTQAEIAVPIVVFDQLRGVLDMQADEIDFFTETDLSIFTTLATQLGIAMENASQYAQVQETLVEVTALQRAMTREGWQAFLTAREKPVYGFATADAKIKPITKTTAADEREALHLQDVKQDETAVTTPVLLGATTIGSIGVRTAEDALSDEQQVLLQAISEQVGQALERARLSEQMQVALNETEARTEELGLLNQMSQELTAQTNVDGVLDVAYQYTSQMMAAEEFYVALYYQEMDEVEFALTMTRGKPRRYTERRQAGEGLTEYIIRNRQPLLMSNNVDQHLASLGIAAIGNPAESWVGVPLTFSGKVIGVMALQSYETGYTYSEQHLNLLVAIASQAAIAIENARLIEATTTRAEEERMLRQITARVNTAVDAESILRTAAEEIGRALGLEGYVRLDAVGDTSLPSFEKATNGKGN